MRQAGQEAAHTSEKLEGGAGGRRGAGARHGAAGGARGQLLQPGRAAGGDRGPLRSAPCPLPNAKRPHSRGAWCAKRASRAARRAPGAPQRPCPCQRRRSPGGRQRTPRALAGAPTPRCRSQPRPAASVPRTQSPRIPARGACQGSKTWGAQQPCAARAAGTAEASLGVERRASVRALADALAARPVWAPALLAARVPAGAAADAEMHKRVAYVFRNGARPAVGRVGAGSVGRVW